MKQLYTTLIICFIAVSAKSQTTFLIADSIMKLPEPVTNTAVASYGEFVYYFGGLDSTKNLNGIHLRSYKIDIYSKTVTRLPDLPDTLGKIAMSASRVGDKIYIIGGYHVLQDSTEVTSNKVHVFDIFRDTFLEDAAPLPVPVDDHVQFTYKDSLIYCITGWSNNGNVSNVQIFNPDSNKWIQGTPVPGLGHYRVFGASGGVIGNNIYYLGGAGSGGPGFEAKSLLRIGEINPDTPSMINWTSMTPQINAPLYRGAWIGGYVSAGNNWFEGEWVGGSFTAYNYDGIGYDDTTKATPCGIMIGISGDIDTSGKAYNIEIGTLPWHMVDMPMDIRGLGLINSTPYLIGGMDANQRVLDRVTTIINIGNVTQLELINVSLYPNPASTQLTVDNEDGLNLTIEIYTPQGQVIKTHTTSEYVSNLNVEDLPNGTYFVRIVNEQNVYYQKIVIQH